MIEEWNYEKFVKAYWAVVLVILILSLLIVGAIS